MSDLQPLKYPIYKGMGGKQGAVQFTYRPPHFFCTEDRKHKFFSGETVRTASFNRDTPCPREGCNGTLMSRDGCVFLDISSAVGKNKYDWKNKIMIQLSIKDLGQLLVGLGTGKNVSIIHDPGAGTDNKGQVVKTLSFSSPKGLGEGGFLSCSMSSGRDKEKVEHRVGMTADEIIVLRELLKSVIPKALAWEN